MQIRHILPTTSCRATVTGDRAFFLRNQLGDMLSFYTSRQTRYEGWYLNQADYFYKLVERIELLGSDNSPQSITAITNTGHSCFWQFSDTNQLGWKLTSTHTGMALRLTQPGRLRLTLDIRGIYTSPQLGRNYQISEDINGYLLEYSDPTLPQPIFLHLRTKDRGQLLNHWEERDYPRDSLRHSEPTKLYTFTALEITTDHLSLGAGWNKEEALKASAMASAEEVTPPLVSLNHTHETLLNQLSTTKLTVTQALRWLQTSNGLYAGLPWFHQVWSRDELIASLGLTPAEQEEIITTYLGKALENGELPTYTGSHSTCSDGIGWLCLLIQEYGIDNLSEDNRERLIYFLKTAHQDLKIHRQANHGLITSGHNATWMDTVGRNGFPLEIQCMYALVLQHLHTLTGESSYEQERLQMLGKIRLYFAHDGYLWDGLNDGTKRPNVFLAYLLQPELLTQQAWQKCFDIILTALTCPWGGLSSLDHNHPNFQPLSTGQDNRSYHNGDSWFFINNLAAIALRRLNQQRYGKAIMGIVQSSTDEILWQNMLGQPGEISSASQLDSYGCGIQAFSAGTYLALLRELEVYSGHARDSIEFFWESTAD